MKTTAIILAVLALYANESHAAFLEVGKGQYNIPSNGIYWQDGFNHDFEMKGTYVRLGVEKEEKEFNRFVFRGSFFSLGRYTMNADATPSDYQYNDSTPNHCNGTCPPLNKWIVSGNVMGVSLTAGVKWGPVSIELGRTFYQKTTSVHVHEADGDAVNRFNVDNVKNYAIGKTAGINWQVNKKVSLGIAVYLIGSDFKDSNLSLGENMPSGVGKVVSGSIGIRF